MDFRLGVYSGELEDLVRRYSDEFRLRQKNERLERETWFMRRIDNTGVYFFNVGSFPPAEEYKPYNINISILGTNQERVLELMDEVIEAFDIEIAEDKELQLGVDYLKLLGIESE